MWTLARRDVEPDAVDGGGNDAAGVHPGLLWHVGRQGHLRAGQDGDEGHLDLDEPQAHSDADPGSVAERHVDHAGPGLLGLLREAERVEALGLVPVLRVVVQGVDGDQEAGALVQQHVRERQLAPQHGLPGEERHRRVHAQGLLNNHFHVRHIHDGLVCHPLASGLRSQGEIVLTVASSGIASLLLPGGRTAHSKFAIPIPTFENSTCNIDQGSELAELLKVAKLIIWDEAPMAHKFCFEAFDKSLRDIMRFSDNANSPFGGKVIVFGGDFRQILPVIPKGSRSDIINATINASFLWEHCHVLKLTKNMRLENDPNNVGTRELGEFSQWILDVGDGKIAEPNDGYASIEIPESFLITDFRDPIEAIVQSTFPSLMHQYKNIEFLQSRAILASTIETVDKINDYVLSLIPSDEKEYLSSDSTDRSEPDQNTAITPEFLNTLTASGLPNHMIKLKIGAPIMLLRNLDHSEGLCNGTRLIVTRLANYVIEARIMSGNNIGNLTYIPRMSMSLSQSLWPFKLIRRQFPLVVSYAMTINKSQGQSLANVGLYLPKPVFNHGQLYVALSRVQHKKGLKILIHDKDGRPLSTTTNVVFKEVFQNL